jgi:hypothetical protein
MLRKSGKRPRRSNWRKAFSVAGPPLATVLPEVAAKAMAHEQVRKTYLDWLHGQPCVVGQSSSDPCQGDVEAAHQDEGKGMGMKTSDDTCIPLCTRHHRLLGNGVHGTSVHCAGSFLRLLTRLIHRLALRNIRQQYLARGSWTPMERDLPWKP